MTLPQPPAPQLTTCYRHPTREAGRRCTRCGRPACNECLVRADIGSQCVECAKAGRPDVRTRARYWNARQPVLVTYTLMAINLGVFIWVAVDDSSSMSGQDRITERQFDLGLSEFFLTVNDEWYRLVTSGFLHFGILHLAFNMLLLYQLGNLLEPILGRIRFALLYGAALLGGSAGVLLLQPNSFAGGASGAVFGLLGAAAVWQLRQGINPLSTGIGTVLILNIMITFWVPNISIGGHLGGLTAGAAAGWFMLAPRSLRVPQWLTYAAPVVVGAAALAVSYVLAS
jgi:membrane associated rhomboid family serine protease